MTREPLDLQLVVADLGDGWHAWEVWLRERDGDLTPMGMGACATQEHAELAVRACVERLHRTIDR